MLESLNDRADHIVRDVSTHPIECRATLVEELVRIYGNAVALPESHIIASKEHVPGGTLRKRDRDCNQHLYARGLPRSRIENRGIHLSSIEVPAQDGIGLTRIRYHAKSSFRDKLSTDLLRQHIQQSVSEGSTGKCGDRDRLNAFRNEIRLAADMIATACQQSGSENRKCPGLSSCHC